MATTSTKTEICNIALSEIGNEGIQITDFDTDTGKAARQCRLHYQSSLEELLRYHTWGCAKKRVEPIGTVPSIDASDGEVFTDQGATVGGKAQFLNGLDAVADFAIEWNDTSEEWEYGTYATPTITPTFTNSSADLVPPEDGWDAVTSGELTLTQNYDFGWDTAYRLPSDCLRPVFLTNSERNRFIWKRNVDWTVERRTILSNHDQVFLLYIIEPEITQMDSLFVRALSVLLASKLAKPLSGDKVLKKELLIEFNNVIMPEARRVNGFEGWRSPIPDSEWLEATYTSQSSAGRGYPPFSQSDFGTFNW